MAEEGTLLGEVQRGWSRFWGLSWWWKGPVLGLIAFIFIGIVGSIAGDGDDDTDTAVRAATPTETSEIADDDPTATPEITPTATNQPTPTPEATVDETAIEELVYLAAISDWVDGSQDIILEIVTQANTLADAPALIPLYEDDALDLSIRADRLQADMHDLEAPPRFAEVHSLLTQAADSLQSAAEKWWLELSLIDVDLIGEATSDMEDVSTYLNQATTLIGELD